MKNIPRSAIQSATLVPIESPYLLGKVSARWLNQENVAVCIWIQPTRITDPSAATWTGTVTIMESRPSVDSTLSTGIRGAATTHDDK